MYFHYMCSTRLSTTRRNLNNTNTSSIWYVDILISSPLSPINNNGSWWCCASIVVANTLCFWGANVSLVQVSSLRTATALNRHIIQSTAGIRFGQGAARVVAGLHTVGELLVLLTFHSYGRTLWLT